MSSRIARSMVSVDFLRIRKASVDREGIRAPEVCPNRSSTAYSRTAASLTSASSSHCCTIANRSSTSSGGAALPGASR
jgi:hypothetical protein